MNNARKILSQGSTLLRGCWFGMKKLRFQKNFGKNFNAVERVIHTFSIPVMLNFSFLVFWDLLLFLSPFLPSYWGK
jgi:hypothetical protein